MGWPADKQAETNTNLMQSGSEPPLERGEKLDTELMLQPISSCIQHCSYCSHCQVSGVLSLLRVALAFHISSPTPRYLPDPSAWKPLPCSFPSLQLESPRRTQPELPGYHLSDLGHVTSAFQTQENWGARQFAMRRAENMTTAGFPLKTSVPSDSDLMPQEKKKNPIQASLGNHLPAQRCPSWSLSVSNI